MRVAIIGAGLAGLTTAKVLLQAGHDVEVFDRAPEVGGVWSRTRRYPGLTTQSPKAQYSFSDFPMPREFPEWPTGAQIQEYLAAYADEFGVTPHLRLGTEVTSVVPDGGRWVVTTTAQGAAGFDRVVLANGVFCEPALPDYPGRAEFEAAGGRLLAGSDFHDVEDARGEHVLVVGYGKSACDVTVAISGVAASTDVIARQLLWKVPRKIAGFLNFKMLLLTRLGEALFRYRWLRGFEKFLHGPGNRLRRAMLNSVGSVSVRQFGLARHDLVPRGRMEDIVKNAIGLATEGFFEGVADGSIRVHRDQVITRLFADGDRPHAELADGSVLPAGLVVCATGFTQGVPFLPVPIQERLFDERGNFLLYRQIQPIGVPGLYFNGYNSSFFSPLNAEMAALWIAADLGGALTLPDETARREDVVAQLAFLDVATGAHHCRGTKIIPFSIHNVDEVLGDLGVQLGRFTRFTHWLNPVAPAAYRSLTPQVLARLENIPESAKAPL
ncbi:flavin-containing monooxygenase [Amycolatopsis mediterranei S699]|uniref:Flavin-containing monooxygenase n=2 Tax=Amycolatopsis mediterranei TaxID=33910 RepID=A0A0H3DAZ3_AMYMU|nr:NAD(P)/FAD-dependent oxidoreductase [Amycolatopsis mediterranei]ADJ47452.1 flavin-containing monooxygenase [Amycolatopsis mediterranei U32]AEK44300.1 flavin-containing monooxygenase [Amycolatopsis mediterranei S699]AFO79163.1 flavin-containing monooxygenase [Amycolatopsis mediterranei S699]AGT86291.1 flavin-containing monooxygenase [Amycolatopsis mediterranei RB]KDO12623.1 monooxygenase [Amycolatopsis mediterranei]